MEDLEGRKQIGQEETDEDPYQDGHKADRTDMLPWESCCPDCPVCAEFEK